MTTITRMGKGDRIRGKRAVKAARLARRSPEMLAYCPVCDLEFGLDGVVAAVLDVTYRDGTGTHRRLSSPDAIEMTCPSCGTQRTVNNLIVAAVPLGTVAVFGVSPAERAKALALADHLAGSEGLDASQVADEIEREARWLRRLAARLREDPVTQIAAAALAASVIFGVLDRLPSDEGVTRDQFERLIDATIDSHVHSDLPPPAVDMQPEDSAE